MCSFSACPMFRCRPGKKNYRVDDMIKNVEKGIYIIGDGSFSIDQQRYNFQFGGQTFYEIKNGKIVGMLNDVAYQANTQEFWNSCAAIAMKVITGWAALLTMAKGSRHSQMQYRMVASTARFNGINVINTARKI